MAASPAHDGYLLCVFGSCLPGSTSNLLKHAGGTSAATPSLAGIVALIDQNQGERQGPINAVLYKIAGAQEESQCDGSDETILPRGAPPCIFNDVTRGNTAIAGGDPTLYPATPGFDLASGLGSINAANLANEWNSSKTATTLTLTTTPAFAQQGTSVTLQAAVNAKEPGPIPTGTVTFYNSTEQIGSPVTVGLGLAAFAQATASLSVSTLGVGANPILAAYSGDAVYMPSVTPVQMVNVSSAAAGCAVANFIASPNPAPLTGEFGVTTLFIDAPCEYDVRIGAISGPLFATLSGVQLSATTGAWVDDHMVFYLQEHGNTTPAGTLAMVTVRLAEPASTACIVSDFEGSPNPVIARSSTGETIILVNANCAYDVREGSTSGTVLGSGIGLAQFPTGPLANPESSFFLQLHGDKTAQGTLQSFTVSVI